MPRAPRPMRSRGRWSAPRPRRTAPASALVLCLVVGCAQTQKVPPTPFKASEAFKQIRKDALGFLDHDFNGDGVDDAVVVTQHPPGMSVQVYMQSPSEHGGVWHEVCTSPLLLGEELDTLKWIKPGPRQLLLVVASSENPDMLQQSFALFPERAPCTAVFQDKVALVKPSYELVSPGEVPGGVLVDDTDHVRVIDQAQTVQLRGATGEVDLLKAVRERILGDDGVRITVEEKPRTFVTALDVETRWRTAAGTATDAVAISKIVPELSDKKADTAFTIAPDDDGVLEITSSAPMVILDIAHGCGDASVPLTLTPDTAAADTHVIGNPPQQSSFIQGVGRRALGDGSERRDVLALREPTTHLAVRVGPPDRVRCLREVRAYGFITP